jgi:hypothetical protein
MEETETLLIPQDSNTRRTSKLVTKSKRISKKGKRRDRRSRPRKQ